MEAMRSYLDPENLAIKDRYPLPAETNQKLVDAAEILFKKYSYIFMGFPEIWEFSSLVTCLLLVDGGKTLCGAQNILHVYLSSIYGRAGIHFPCAQVHAGR